MNKALSVMAFGLSLAAAAPTFAQYSPNCLTNKIDISSGYDYAAAALYPASPNTGAPILDHYWEISAMPATSTGITAPKCAERFIASMVGSSWPNSTNCSYIGVVANAQTSNTAQLSPTGNFFWNCPPSTPYTPTMTPTTFTRSFYVQSLNPTELITVNIPNFWGDDYAVIYLDNNPATTIYSNPSVSQTGGVIVTPVSFNVTPGAHTVDVRLWDVSGQGTGIKVSGYITSTNNVLVANSCYGISDKNCKLVPPPPVCNSAFTLNLTLHTGAGPYTIPDRSVQLALDNYVSSSTYTVDYGDGTGVFPYNPAPYFHTYATPGSYTVCISEVTAAGTQCKSCYTFCIGDYSKSARPANTGNATGIQAVNAKQYEVLISPNPTSGTSDIRLDLVNDDNVKVSVIDPTGRNMADVFNGFVSKGTKTITIDTHKYAAGIYQVRVMVGNQLSTHKLSVVK